MAWWTKLKLSQQKTLCPGALQKIPVREDTAMYPKSDRDRRSLSPNHVLLNHPRKCLAKRLFPDIVKENRDYKSLTILEVLYLRRK